MDRKRIYKKILIIFMITAVALTFISSQIYYLLLPEVTVSQQAPGILVKTFDVSAVFDYREKEEICIPIKSRIDRIFVSVNDEVFKGFALFSLNKTELLKTLYSSEINIDTYSEQQKSYEKESSKYKLLSLLIEEEKNRISWINTLVSQDQVLQSKTDGVVTSISVAEGNNILNDSVIMEVASKDNNMVLRWKIKDEYGKLFSLEDTIKTFLTIATENEDGEIEEKNKMFELPITKIIFDKKDNYTLFECSINIDDNVSMVQGQETNIQMRYSSVEYQYTIPISAVRFLENSEKGSVYVIRERKKIFGTEKYVEKEIFDISEIDARNVAITSYPIAFNKDIYIVTSSNKALSDNSAVKVSK